MWRFFKRRIPIFMSMGEELSDQKVSRLLKEGYFPVRLYNPEAARVGTVEELKKETR